MGNCFTQSSLFIHKEEQKVNFNNRKLYHTYPPTDIIEETNRSPVYSPYPYIHFNIVPKK